MPATAGKFGSKDALTPSGRQKTESTEAQEAAAKQMMEISKDLWQSTGGLRDATTGQLETFLLTGRMPRSLDLPIQDVYRSGREGLENQYRVAREQLLNTTPSEGGQLNDQLRDLAVSRAQAVGGLESQIKAQMEVPLAQQLFAGALSTGYGQPPVAISGLSSAGGQFGNIATRSQSEQLFREQQSKEEVQQIGQMVGMAFT